MGAATSQADDDLLSAALTYAAKGCPVFPLEPGGKRPLGRLAPHGLKDAATDPDVITKWWAAEPAANIGLTTGDLFDVLDIDGPDGHASLVMEMAETDEPIWGPTTCTGGGGWHAFVAPTGLGNRAGFVPKCDWRGVGGYIVAPPSVHPNGRQYTWFLPNDELVGIDAPIRPAPPWLLHLLARPEPANVPVVTTRPTRSTGTYAQRALEAEAGKVLLAPPGQRNHTLNVAAYSLGQLVAAGALDPYEVADALLKAASRCGLGEQEARRTIASGLRSGLARPRTLAS
jgi:hypothetical protein